MSWAAVPFLLKRLHGDGVEVSFELVLQGFWVGVPVGRCVPRLICQGA
jgi:hypothetical protein